MESKAAAFPPDLLKEKAAKGTRTNNPGRRTPAENLQGKERLIKNRRINRKTAPWKKPDRFRTPRFGSPGPGPENGRLKRPADGRAFRGAADAQASGNFPASPGRKNFPAAVMVSFPFRKPGLRPSFGLIRARFAVSLPSASQGDDFIPVFFRK
jgi:hypothetical protein